MGGLRDANEPNVIPDPIPKEMGRGGIKNIVRSFLPTHAPIQGIGTMREPVEGSTRRPSPQFRFAPQFLSPWKVESEQSEGFLFPSSFLGK